MNHLPPTLDELLADAGAELERAAGSIVPDFADVLARARRASSVAAPSVAAARVLGAWGDASGEHHLARSAQIGGLDALLHSAREHNAAQAERIEREQVPATPLPVRRSGTRWAALAVLAAALVAAFALGWGRGGDRLELGRRPEYSGASQTRAAQPWSQALREVGPRPAARAAGHARSELPAPSRLPQMPAASVAPTPTPEPAPTRALPRRPRVDALAELDRSARAAWQRGDLAAAEATLEQLVARGRRGALVDIAYGDLFELARQRRDAANEARLWRRYLKTFPRGRYADEASAGLCRAARGDTSLDCWRRYLDARPDGTWRAQARAAIAGAVDRTD